MNLNIQKLLQHELDEIILDKVIEMPLSYYQNSEIISLSPITLKGTLQQLEDTLLMQATVTGEMVIPDSISLEPISYPFSFEIDDNVQEKIKNDENTLAIMDILWENIVLEIPIRYSKVNDYSNFSGDGWKLIDEEHYQASSGDNPFKELLEEFGEE